MSTLPVPTINFGAILNAGEQFASSLVAAKKGQPSYLDTAIQTGLSVFRGLGGNVPGDQDMSELNNRISDLSSLIYQAQDVSRRAASELKGQTSYTRNLDAAIASARNTVSQIGTLQRLLTQVIQEVANKNLSKAGVDAAQYFAQKRAVLSRFAASATGLQGAINAANAAMQAKLTAGTPKVGAYLQTAGRVITQAGGTALHTAEGVGEALTEAAPYTKYIVWGVGGLIGLVLVMRVMDSLPKGERR